MNTNAHDQNTLGLRPSPANRSASAVLTDELPPLSGGKPARVKSPAGWAVPRLGAALLAACLMLLFCTARASEVSAPSPLFTLDTVLRPAHLGGTASGPSGLFTLDTRSPEWGGIQIQPAGTVRLELKGQPGRQYDLETSTNLLDWAYLYTLTATSSITIYAEPKADGPISRFYRAVLR
jgi:hypothetical protein